MSDANTRDPIPPLPILRGRWRHSNGMIFCGTLRIAKGDFDTNPHPDFCALVFDDICRTMNKAQNVFDEKVKKFGAIEQITKK